jgi:hypothetical protein
MYEIKTEKVLGYILLGAGLLCVLITAYNVYTVFTGASAAPQIFKMDAIEIPATGNSPAVVLMSAQNLDRLMGLALWYILMFFFLQVGAKIAGLGIQLIREIKVSVKSKEGITSVPME